MQAIMETIFDVVYLGGVVTLGILMIRRSGGKAQYRLFGWMAVILGAGDSFHLVPRAYALLTDGLANHPAALGFGKLVTSVTMTVFYLILYRVWRERYQIKDTRGLDAAVYSLAGLRVVLCLFPQNDWLSASPPVSWGILRNIPFAILGLLLIVLYYREAKACGDREFRLLWLAITISFACYIPVVLWAEAVPTVGILMIPKTAAYFWIVWMGWAALRKTPDFVKITGGAL